jgi:hypothetical protein
VRCNAYPAKECTKVTILLLDHYCAGSAPIAYAQASRLDWLQQVVPTILKVEAKTTSKAIVDAVQLHFQHTIAAKQAQYVQKLILNASQEHLVADYSKILKYLQAFYKGGTYLCMQSTLKLMYIQANPFTLSTGALRTKMENTLDGKFQRLFIMLGVAEGTFTNCLPLVLLNSTFFLNAYRQVILLAIGRDGENWPYLIAWAIVESENTES